MTAFQPKLNRPGPAYRRLPVANQHQVARPIDICPIGMASILSRPRYVDLPQDAGWRALKEGSRPTRAVLWTLPYPCYQQAMPG
jgi:hypothetical protein